MSDDPVDSWWQEEIRVLQTLAVEAQLEEHIAEMQKQQDERYKTWLVVACTGASLIAFLVALYAIFFVKK